MAGRDLSIVVPVYNERHNIQPLVESLDKALKGIDWEVIFVDDDSPDRTATAVAEVAQVDDRVRLVLRIHDRGLSKSCVQGLLSGRAETLCVMDGDGQHDPSVIRKLVQPILDGNADIVSAARRLDQNLDSLSTRRQALSRLGSRLCQTVLRRPIGDPLTGFFAIRRDAFLSVARDLSDSGFKLLFDILATGRHLRHKEVQFDFGERLHGESKLDLANIWQFAMLLAEKLTGGFVPAKLVSFLVVGGSGVGVHFVVLLPLLAFNAPFAVAQACAAVTAATSNFLLNNQLTFRDRRLSGSSLFAGWLAFLLVSAVGLFANVAVASIAFDRMHGFAIIAAMAGIAMDAIWKFVISSRFVWRFRKQKQRSKAELLIDRGAPVDHRGATSSMGSGRT